MARIAAARLCNLAAALSAGMLACALSAARAAPAPAVAAGWDAAQQRQVMAAGLMSASGGSFSGAAPLSASQANAAMAALSADLQPAGGEQPRTAEAPAQRDPGGRGEAPMPAALATAGAPASAPMPAPLPTAGAPASAPVTAPVAQTTQNPVTLVTFDRLLVEQLGLAAVAEHVQAVTAAAGLAPPPYFGSEVVARFLELRYEHSVGSQRLDLFPWQAITRAEAAWSLAHAIGLGAWSVSSARESLSAFALPQMNGPQRTALRIAVSRIGYPYVWGGTTDGTSDGLEHGGFDCSGFAWRVFKVSGLPWGGQILGRTAAEQAGEIPRSERLRASSLAPGDLLFFGSAHFSSRATEGNVIHEGIYMGGNWVIHSSGQGVYVLPLSGSWLGSSFAWGRRLLP